MSNGLFPLRKIMVVMFGKMTVSRVKSDASAMPVSYPVLPFAVADNLTHDSPR
jgi:hypothetical protein